MSSLFINLFYPFPVFLCVSVFIFSWNYSNPARLERKRMWFLNLLSFQILGYQPLDFWLAYGILLDLFKMDSILG